MRKDHGDRPLIAFQKKDQRPVPDRSLESCCNRINSLPYGDAGLAIECKYENIRKFNYLRFVKEDVDSWDSYKPKEEEKKLFYGCLEVKRKLDETLQLEAANG